MPRPSPRRAPLLFLLGAAALAAGTARADAPLDRAAVEAWIAPTDEDREPLPIAAIEVEDGRVVVRFVAGGERCALRLFPVGEAGPGDMSSRSLGMRREGAAAGACGELVSRAVNRIQTHDRRPLAERAPSPRGGVGSRGPVGGGTGASWSGLDLWLIAFGLVLVLLLVPALAQSVLMLDRRSRILAAGTALVAFAVRALAPHRMVMVYFGYKHVGEAVDLSSLPRYGPGATLLWWLLFRAAPRDHASVQWLHVVLGSLAMGLFAAWVHRVSRSVRAAASVGALLALTPLLVRDHGSESMAVAAVLALAGAAVLVAEVVPLAAAPGPRPPAARRALAALVVLVLYVASCRPDLALVVLPVVVCLALAAHPPRDVARAFARAWPYVLVAAVLAVPLLVSGVRHSRADVAMGNLPRLATLSRTLPFDLFVHDVLLHPRDFPVLAWLPVGVALATPGTSRRAAWLVLAALISIAPTFVDFNETSNLRLQAPAAVLLLAATGFGFAALERRPRGPRLVAGALALVVLSMLPSVRPLFRARNPDQEDRLIRRALDAIQRDGTGPARLARAGYDDVHVPDVHLYFPDYLFAARGIATVGLGEVIEQAGGRRDYFLRSFRCWLWPAWDREKQGPEQPACHDVCEKLRCTPVFEEDASNLGDWPTFDGYGPADRLHVGLYRVEPK